MKVNLIAAIGKRGQLGFKGELPWHNPDDLGWFREETTNSLLIVGYKTYPSVMCLDMTFGRRLLIDDLEIDKRGACTFAQSFGLNNVWIIGGAKTYVRWLNMGAVDRSYIAHIDYDGPADAWFPVLRDGKWEINNATL